MTRRKTTVLLVLILFSYLPFIVPSAVGFVVAAILFYYVTLKVLPFAIIHGVGEVGLHRHQGWLPLLIGGLAIGCMFNCLAYVILSRSEIVRIELPPTGDILLISLFAFSTAGFTAFAEELIFRGYLVKVFRPHVSWAWVIVITCTLFTLYHLPQWGLPLPYWIRFFVMGVVFTIPLIVTRSLWMSVGIHLGGNFVYYLLLTESGFLAVAKTERVTEAVGWVSVGVALVLLGLAASTAGLLHSMKRSPTAAQS
jgi:membrane protease YdiL (CAAX protease family)